MAKRGPSPNRKTNRGREAAHLMAAALAHHRAGRFAGAETLYRKILSRHPDDAEALANLGAVLRAQGRLDEAVASLRRAIAVNPGHAGAHNNLGNALHQRGDPKAAAASYQAALACDPNQAEVLCNLGNALTEAGLPQAAESSLRGALSLKPGLARAHYHLGLCLHRQGRHREAIEAHENALGLDPGNARIENDLGNALFAQDRIEEAARHYQRAVAIDPGLVPAHINVANTLFELMRVPEAIASYGRALAIEPDHGEARSNRALALLQAGRFEEGWREYEWRWRKPGYPPPRDFGRPLWDGSPLAGATILLHAEQGQGDAIQFVRYAPLVAGRGGRVLVECQASLAGLLESVPGVDAVVTAGAPPPPFDVQAPLLSLPRIFRTTLDSIPAAVPYVAPPSAPAGAVPATGRVRIGIAWAGNPANVNDRKRSVDPRHFQPIVAAPGTDIYIVQVGAGREAIGEHAFLGRATDLGDKHPDFRATAGFVRQLDLVITVDTALAHLAGAMARPVWTLLPFRPDWRWLTGGDHSPWYPTMRLFRQPARGDWAAVFEAVRLALAGLVREGANGRPGR